MRQKFKKSERLTGRKPIERLFRNGKSFFVAPFRVVHCADEETVIPLRVIFTVSKKNFSSAVQRNRLRRRMREAWRKWKQPIYMEYEHNSNINVAIQYSSYTEADYPLIEEKIKVILQRLQNQYSRQSDKVDIGNLKP